LSTTQRITGRRAAPSGGLIGPGGAASLPADSRGRGWHVIEFEVLIRLSRSAGRPAADGARDCHPRTRLTTRRREPRGFEKKPGGWSGTGWVRGTACPSDPAQLPTTVNHRGRAGRWARGAAGHHFDLLEQMFHRPADTSDQLETIRSPAMRVISAERGAPGRDRPGAQRDPPRGRAPAAGAGAGPRRHIRKPARG